MANVGTATLGFTLIGQGITSSPKFAAIGSGSGLTSHGIVIARGTGAFVASAAMTNGQLLIGVTGSDPTPGTLTAGTGISITNASGSITIAISGSVVGETITGNDAVALNPTSGNWNILGTGSLTTSGSVSTLTIALTGLTNHAVLVGAGTATITKVGPTATSGQILQSQGSSSDPAFSTATYPSTTTINQLLFSSAANVVGGVTVANQAVLTTTTGGVPTWITLTNGQLIIGSTAGNPTAATLTAGTGISITNASNSITIAINGSVVGETITGNDSVALSPTAGNWNILGTGSLTTSGSVSTLTIALTGLTNHAVLVGAGTATITKVGPTATSGQILQSQGSSSDPAFSTATYPSTTTINQLLFSSAANVVGGVTVANQAVLTTTTGGVPTWITLTNGQLIIGSTAGNPTAATLTAGTGIAITNAANSITITATAGGFAWSETSGTFNAAKENGYFITNTSTATLPASPSEGDTIKFIVDTTNLLTVTANTGQKIRIGTQLSAAAGTAVNTQRGDALSLVYQSTATTWFAEANPVGGWNVT